MTRGLFLFLFLFLFIADASEKDSFKIYIETDQKFTALQSLSSGSVEGLISKLPEIMSEILPKGLVIVCAEDTNLLNILRIVDAIESASPETQIRVVTSSSYKKKPVLREFIVTPLN